MPTRRCASRCCFSSCITESEPLIKGSGIPQLEGQFHGHFSPKPLAVLIKKFIAGTLGIVCGLSLGREGPSIQLGAMSGQLVSSRLPKSEEEDNKLLLLLIRQIWKSDIPSFVFSLMKKNNYYTKIKLSMKI